VGLINGGLQMHTYLKPLKMLQIKSPMAFRQAMEKAMIQFLTWCNTGSMNETRKPPIRFGVLRGSSSAFVGNKLVKTYQQAVTGNERPTPATSCSAKDLVGTVVYNTEYATRMHESKYKPGPYSAQDGDAGNKWLEKHLDKDRNDLMKVIGMEFKKQTGI
jgi:hypothetical protein